MDGKAFSKAAREYVGNGRSQLALDLWRAVLLQDDLQAMIRKDVVC
jgi:hypothetical protein